MIFDPRSRYIVVCTVFPFTLKFQRHRNNTACQMAGNVCALTLHDKTLPACKLIKLIERRFHDGFPKLFFPDTYKPESHKDAITNTITL